MNPSQATAAAISQPDRISIPVLDVEKIRRDFPVLTREVKGKGLVYLDSAATSQKPQVVIDKVVDCYIRVTTPILTVVCIHSARKRPKSTREPAKSWPRSWALTGREWCSPRNCTEAINLVAYSWARRNLGPGDRLLATEMEHHSNMVPWQMAARDAGFAVDYLPVTDSGYLDYSLLDDYLTASTKLVAVSGASNVLGTINDLDQLIKAAKQAGALVLVDGAQLVPHAPVDFDALGVDFLAIAGHKMLGPSGNRRFGRPAGVAQ